MINPRYKLAVLRAIAGMIVGALPRPLRKPARIAIGALYVANEIARDVYAMLLRVQHAKRDVREAEAVQDIVDALSQRSDEESPRTVVIDFNPPTAPREFTDEEHEYIQKWFADRYEESEE